MPTIECVTSEQESEIMIACGPGECGPFGG